MHKCNLGKCIKNVTNVLPMRDLLFNFPLLKKKENQGGFHIFLVDLIKNILSLYTNFIYILPTTLKRVITAPQPVIIIISLSKGNALAIKDSAYTFYNGTPQKGCVIQKYWLSDEIRRYQTYGHFKCLAFDIS